MRAALAFLRRTLGAFRPRLPDCLAVFLPWGEEAKTVEAWVAGYDRERERILAQLPDRQREAAAREWWPSLLCLLDKAPDQNAWAERFGGVL